MLDLTHLKTFHVVARTSNFTEAAAILGYSQSSVTTHIKALEKELGALLLIRERFSRNVSLTKAGDLTLAYARKLLALAEQTRQAAKQAARS